jgi:uncharacterized membrane protein
MYGTSLVLGLLVAIPLFTTLSALDENSLAFMDLMPGFDYTVYKDFTHVNGKAISPLLSVGRWASVLYVVLSVFFTGGIFMRFTQPSIPIRADIFWQACSHYFRRNLRLIGITIPMAIVVFLVPFISSIAVAAATEESLTERGLFYIGFTGFIIGFVLATLVFCISDYAKALLFREDEQGAFRAFGLAGRLVLRNPRATFGRYWLLIGVGTIVFGIYFFIDSLIGMYNTPTIILMLVVQQVFIFSRIALKTWNLGVIYEQYQLLPKPVVPVKQVLVPADVSTTSEAIITEETSQPALDPQPLTTNLEQEPEGDNQEKDPPNNK